MAAMSAGLPVPPGPLTTVAGVIARMEAIEAALPATDGLACFNRMYLQVTRQISSRLGEGFFDGFPIVPDIVVADDAVGAERRLELREGQNPLQDF